MAYRADVNIEHMFLKVIDRQNVKENTDHTVRLKRMLKYTHRLIGIVTEQVTTKELIC